MGFTGAPLRILQTLLRGVQLCCALVACGIFASFLAILANNDLPVSRYTQAVTGMSGAAIIYTGFAVILTLCLAGITFLSILAIILDILFAGCFIAVAYFSREGARSCSGFVNTEIGSGPAEMGIKGATLGRACKMETAVFAVAILAAILFLLSAIIQLFLIRHHKKEKRYGPSPSNNYTAGAGRKPFWKRNRTKHIATRDSEMGPAHATTTYGRPSHDTGYTDNTLVGAGAPSPKYGPTTGVGGPNYHQGHNNAATNY